MGERVRSADRVARLLRWHDLVRPRPASRILEVVDRAVAVTATATGTAYVALHARLSGFRPAMLDRHLFEARDLVKVHAFRGGYFVVRRSLLSTVLAASAPGREKVCRAYRRGRGVSMTRWRELRERALAALEDDALDARELAKRMAAGPLPETFLRMLSVEGTLVPWTPVSAPSWESATHRLAARSVLFPDVDPSAVDLEAARSVLLRRYLLAYGPASVVDASWWLDANATTVIRLLDGMAAGISWTMDNDTGQELVRLAGRPVPVAKGVPAVLVSGGDHVPRAFRERDFFLRREWYDQVVTYDGNPKASVWVDGEIRGRWSFIRGGAQGYVVLWMFEPPTASARKALARHANHMAAFHGVPRVRTVFTDYPPGLPASGGKPPLPKEVGERVIGLQTRTDGLAAPEKG